MLDLLEVSCYVEYIWLQNAYFSWCYCVTCKTKTITIIAAVQIQFGRLGTTNYHQVAISHCFCIIVFTEYSLTVCVCVCLCDVIRVIY